MALRSRAIGRIVADDEWLSFPLFARTLIGVLVLGIVGARLLFGGDLPYVGNATAVLVALIAVKVGVAAVFRIA